MKKLGDFVTSDKGILTIFLVFLIGLLSLQQYVLRTDNRVEDNILERIESKLDSISNKKDSIIIILDTINREIITNEKHYEKVVDRITTMPESELDSFTRQYLYEFAKSRGIIIR